LTIQKSIHIVESELPWIMIIHQFNYFAMTDHPDLARIQAIDSHLQRGCTSRAGC
jgi:hypothetical protein